MRRDVTKPLTEAEIIETFFRKVFPEPNTGCWIWGAGCTSDGYGAFKFIFRNVPFHTAHRFSFFLHNGHIDSKLCVCHKCDNVYCVNPDHLFLGTHMDNMLDRKRKGREAISFGEQNHHSKITAQHVIEIRNSPLSALELSRIYPLDRNYIKEIKNGKHWQKLQP